MDHNIQSGKITKIEQQVKTKNRYSIYIDDKFSFGISEDTLVKYRLAKGMEIDDRFVHEVLLSEEQNKANAYALRLLSFKARSEQEIRKKMKEKEYEEEFINHSIEILKTNKYLNDENYAIAFTKDKLNLSKLGRGRIKQELYQKGIEKNLIQQVVDEHIDKDEEYEMALELAQKKLNSSYKNDDKEGQYRKLGSFLQRKGFDYEIISKILRQLLR